MVTKCTATAGLLSIRIDATQWRGHYHTKNQNRQIRDCMIYDGTSNESSQDRLHATNADGFGFMECLTLKRSKITYDLNGSGIALRSDWRRSLASPFIVSLAAEPQSSMFSIMDDKNYIITRTYQEKQVGAASILLNTSMG